MSPSTLSNMDSLLERAGIGTAWSTSNSEPDGDDISGLSRKFWVVAGDVDGVKLGPAPFKSPLLEDMPTEFRVRTELLSVPELRLRRGLCSSVFSGIWTHRVSENERPTLKPSKLTGNLTIYARNVEHAASVKTAFKLMAYESLAARWMSGGKQATRRAECRISLISYSANILALITSGGHISRDWLRPHLHCECGCAAPGPRLTGTVQMRYQHHLLDLYMVILWVQLKNWIETGTYLTHGRAVQSLSPQPWRTLHRYSRNFERFRITNCLKMLTR